MDQSKLEVNTGYWCEAQDNMRERVINGFGFTSDWMTKGRDIIKPIV